MLRFGFHKKPDARRTASGESVEAPRKEPDRPELDPGSLLAAVRRDLGPEEESDNSAFDAGLEGEMDADLRSLDPSLTLFPLTRPFAPAGEVPVWLDPLPAPGPAGEEWILDIRHCSRHFRERLNRTLLVGRPDEETGWSPDVDLSGDDCVSRRHLRIDAAGEVVTVEDLQSTNGSLLNGRWLEAGSPTRLNLGDVIQIGEHTLIRVMPAAIAPPEPPEDAPPREIVELLTALDQNPAEDSESRAVPRLPVEPAPRPADMLEPALATWNRGAGSPGESGAEGQ